MKLSSDLPIELEKWNIGPTTRDGFDWAISPRPAHPDVDSLDREQIEALLADFPIVKICSQQNRPLILVAEPEADAER